MRFAIDRRLVDERDVLERRFDAERLPNAMRDHRRRELHPMPTVRERRRARENQLRERRLLLEDESHALRDQSIKFDEAREPFPTRRARAERVIEIAEPA